MYEQTTLTSKVNSPQLNRFVNLELPLELQKWEKLSNVYLVTFVSNNV